MPPGNCTYGEKSRALVSRREGLQCRDECTDGGQAEIRAREIGQPDIDSPQTLHQSLENCTAIQFDVGPIRRRAMTAEQAREVRNALLEQQVIFLHDQDLTPDQFMLKICRRTLAAGVATLALVAAVPALGQGKTLKFVQNGNLTILDPIWTTAYVTRDHGYMGLSALRRRLWRESRRLSNRAQ